MRVLVSWLGTADIDLMKQDKHAALASIALQSAESFDQIIILAKNFEEDWDSYHQWLRKKLAVAGRPFQKIIIKPASIRSVIDYPSITQLMKQLIVEELSPHFDSIAINLTSGTPAMSTVSVLIGKGLSQCEFFQSSKENGVQAVEIPIDFKSNYQAITNERLQSVTGSPPKVESAFDKMICNSALMKNCVARARKISQTDLPTLILGETGTGKEMLTQAIHDNSLRKDKPFMVVNCGAIPENLIDSKLFGHKKGAFTGAMNDQIGLFEAANKGTVFLDEVGELSAEAQVKLLRVLQEGEIVPVGAQAPISVDIRVIAATHRDLLQMIDAGEFREDLYYRLAVGVIELPALRERAEDMADLISALMDEINPVIGKHLEFNSKNISESVIKFAISQPWPGNIRELWNTLNRALLWSEDKTVGLSDFKNAIHLRTEIVNQDAPTLADGNSVDLRQIVDSISKSYILKALELAANNKSKASKMLGMANHQTLLNRMHKLGIE